ncbi:TPA: HD domain-containing protein [Candidatus Poribacteria bacterium]|nr:HD domain-containing protein [Candidatus Poribacteria bacterium]
MTKNEIIDELKQRLSKKLYTHSLATGDMAKQLAKVLNSDEEKAYLAGILHDCAKNMPKKELLIYAHNHKIMIDSITLIQPSLLHGVVGANIAKLEFGIDDPEILHAIETHSTGSKEMSLLDKIIYVSDSAEPNRDYEGVDLIRNLAFNGELDKALLEAMNIKLAYVLSKRIMIHLESIEAWNNIVGALFIKKG